MINREACGVCSQNDIKPHSLFFFNKSNMIYNLPNDIGLPGRPTTFSGLLELD